MTLREGNCKTTEAQRAQRSQRTARGWRAYRRASPPCCCGCGGGFGNPLERAPAKVLDDLLDGFISTAAALVAVKYQPQVREWLLLSHQSAEMGHRLAADYLGLQPLLDLGMRLGEGSGAAIAIPLLRLACVLHTNMATFAEAAVAARL